LLRNLPFESFAFFGAFPLRRMFSAEGSFDSLFTARKCDCFWLASAKPTFKTLRVFVPP